MNAPGVSGPVVLGPRAKARYEPSRPRLPLDANFINYPKEWEAQLAIATEVRKRLAGAGEADVVHVRKAFLTEAERVLARGGRLVYPYGATFVTARKPA